MKYAFGLGTLLVVCSAAPVHAQFGGGPVPFGGFGFQSRRAVVAVGINSGPFGPGFFGPSAPVGYIVTQPRWYSPIVVNNYSLTAPPPTASQPIVIQQIVQQQPAAAPAQAQAPNLADPIMIRPRNQAQAAMNNPPLPGDVRGNFRPLQPQDRPQGMPAMPAKAPDKKADDKKADAGPERNDPLFMGRQTFAGREYGRAARFFKQAGEAHPDNAVAHFLLAQAQLALGKYRDAVASIHAGLRLDKEWPNSRFKPAALYGANAADYGEHRAELQEALKRRPDDPVLLFLSAYQLWFDGQEDEARRLFGQARKLVTEPRFIDLFLIGPPAGPVVAR
jgi:hypothetical protein